MPPTDIAIHFQRALCRSRIAGNCECENDPTNPRARGNLCDHYLEQARALIAECGKEVRELLLASPSLPQPARDDPKWAALIDEKLRLASADILEMEGGKQHQRDPAIKYVLRLWEAARGHYDGLANATAEGRRKREIARRLCEVDGFDADLVVMGYGPHPMYGPKGTTCFTAPIHPVWCLYWRQAEAAIVAVEGEGLEKPGFN